MKQKRKKSLYYLCPKCDADLSKTGKIEINVQRPNNTNGKVFLNMKEGTYKPVFSKNFIPKDGEKLNFFCPECNADLRITVKMKKYYSPLLWEKNVLLLLIQLVLFPNMAQVLIAIISMKIEL